MLIAVGTVMAMLVLTDAVRTTINLTEKTGPIARTMLGIGRRITALLPRRARGTAGLAITVAIVLSWTMGLWLSWFVALLDPAVEIVRTGETTPLGALDVFYVAGFSIFTLGTGDLAAATSAGRVVTVLASATGLFTVTLEVTYLLSLTSAAAHERATARQAFALGDTTVAIVRRAWDGRSFASVEPLLLQLARDLSTLAEQHRTFPVLHDVLPSSRSLALGPSLLALSDAADVMRFAAGGDAALSRLTYQQLTEAIDGVLAGLPPGVQPEEAPQAAPARQVLAAAGIPAIREVPRDERIRDRRAGLFELAAEENWEQAACEAMSLPDQAG